MSDKINELKLLMDAGNVIAAKTWDKPASRNGPGRPRKNPEEKKPYAQGIVDHGEIYGSLFELRYSDPILFKRCLTFFLAFTENTMHCRFQPRSISLLGFDKGNVNKIRIKFDPKKLTSYYCPATIEFGVATNQIKTVGQVIRKMYNMVVWYNIQNPLETANDSPEHTHIDLVNNAMSNTKQQRISCAAKYQPITKEGEEIFDNATPIISFKMNAKFLKQVMSNAKQSGGSLKISQTGPKGLLEFTYHTRDKRFVSTDVFNDPKKISLQSRVPESEIYEIYLNPDTLYSVSDVGAVNEYDIHLHLCADNIILANIDMDGCISISVVIASNNTIH